jgi:hypothetical protein
MSEKTLYERLGGYDAISAVASDLLPRLKADSQLARFWNHRGQDGVAREKQFLIDFLCSSAGGPLYYTGRDMKTSHAGIKSARATGLPSSGTSTPRSTRSRFLGASATRWSHSFRARSLTSSKPDHSRGMSTRRAAQPAA